MPNIEIRSGMYLSGERWYVYVDGLVMSTMLRSASDAEQQRDILERMYAAGRQNVSVKDLA